MSSINHNLFRDHYLKYDIKLLPGQKLKDGLIPCIGEGHFGIVFYAELRQGEDTKLPPRVAVKFLKPLQAMREQNEFLSEVQVLQSLKSRALHSIICCRTEISQDKLPKSWRYINLHGKRGYVRPNSAFIITPFMSGGDANSIADQYWKLFQAKQPIPSNLATEMMLFIYGFVEGMAVLHHHGIIHRDLKLDNVFLKPITIADKQYRVPCISDFGLATDTESQESDFNIGNALAAGPDEHKSLKSDVFAFGIILLSLFLHSINDQNPSRAYLYYFSLTGGKTVGFSELNAYTLRAKYRQGYFICIEKSLLDQGVMPPGLQDLANECMSHSPEERPNFYELHERLIDKHNSLGAKSPYYIPGADLAVVSEYINQNINSVRTKCATVHGEAEFEIAEPEHLPAHLMYSIAGHN